MLFQFGSSKIWNPNVIKIILQIVKVTKKWLIITIFESLSDRHCFTILGPKVRT